MTDPPDSCGAPKPETGIGLFYTGLRASPDGTLIDTNLPTDPLEQTSLVYANLGYFVLRLSQALALRAHHIQTSLEPADLHAPITNLAAIPFPLPPDQLPSLDKILYHHAHHPFGVGRYLNGRVQRFVRHNVDRQFGEVLLLEELHFPFLRLAVSLLRSLGRQGLRYIPVGSAGPEELVDIARLRASIDCSDDTEPIRVRILPDGKPKRIGRILTRAGDELNSETVRSILVMLLLLRGGYHAYTDRQQKAIVSSDFHYTSASFYSENMPFNGIMTLARQLRSQYGVRFGAETRPALKRLYSRLHRPEAIEVVLVGHLLGGVILPLDRIRSPWRSEVSAHHRPPLNEWYHVYARLAFAFGLPAHSTVPTPPAQHENDAKSGQRRHGSVDVTVELPAPKLSRGADVAAVLATAIIVVEQILMECLLPRALAAPSGREALILEDLLTTAGAKWWLSLAHRAASATTATLRAGRQWPEAWPLLALFRFASGLSGLIECLPTLARTGECWDVLLAPERQTALRNLNTATRLLEKLGLYDDIPYQSEAPLSRASRLVAQCAGKGFA